MELTLQVKAKKEVDTIFNNYEDVMSVSDVMEALDCGKNTVYELLSSGELKGFKIGIRTWRIPRVSLEEYVLKCAGIKK